MSDDEMDRLSEIQKRISKLTQAAAEARGYITGMSEAMNSLVDVENVTDEPRTLKKVVGMTRDLGLKMIELGQNLRRVADLVEPVIDDMLKGT